MRLKPASAARAFAIFCTRPAPLVGAGGLPSDPKRPELSCRSGQAFEPYQLGRCECVQSLSPRPTSCARGAGRRINDAADNVDRAAQQRHRRFQRAKAGMGRECDVVHGGERMIGSQRLGVENVKPGMADVAAA